MITEIIKIPSLNTIKTAVSQIDQRTKLLKIEIHLYSTVKIHLQKVCLTHLTKTIQPKTPRHKQTNLIWINFRKGQHPSRYRKTPKPRTTAHSTRIRTSSISSPYVAKLFQSRLEYQHEDREPWEAYLQLVNRTLDQF